MKVLFAVNNEEISESIVKKYQKEYKQIISYKNVYYFNAILKELQKDKTYDRIVISEDLEAFTHTQYDQIDKFIFEKLDSISDEASNVKGNDTPIILICSDRREKSETMLVKLFGIGIYNAIIGNDRSVDEVCRLINRPRVKKEAKTYYQIDTEEVNYQAENENDVSEIEIQNIVAHYKRLGKNEDRYVDSFNNIAAQYNDTQLRIITKFLPLNVRAVLEEKSPKYQQIMSFNNSVADLLRKNKYDDENDETGPSQILLKAKNKDRIFSKPVVIPSAVNMNGTKKLAKYRTENPNEPLMAQNDQMMQEEDYIQEMPQQNEYNISQDNIMQQVPQQEQYTIAQQDNITQQMPKENQITAIPEEVSQPVKRGRGRPRKNVDIPVNQQPVVKRGRGRPRKIVEPVQQVVNQEPEEFVLPGLGNVQQATYKPEETEPEDDVILPGLNYAQQQTYQQESVEEPEDDFMLPGLNNSYGPQQQTYEEEQEEEIDDFTLPGLNNYEPQQQQQTYQQRNSQNVNIMSNLGSMQQQPQQMYQQGTTLTYNQNNLNNNREDNDNIEKIDLTSLLTPDKKIITFIGTSKNGTSFIVNNIAELMSSIGINTAILDTTRNRNSYYIYTKNEEPLREIAIHSIGGLAHGLARGINVHKNLTVYTSLPDESDDIKHVDKILETLLMNHSLILIDTDFSTPHNYFKQSQETYLVQSMDILTIQPLTAFLKELKMKNILDEKKLRIVLNKVVKIRGIRDEVIIGGMAFYNDPSMSFMTELFDRDRIKYISIPFEDETYIRYLEGVIECEISLKGYSKIFLQALRELGNMIYPIVATSQNSQNYQPPSAYTNGGGNFSNNMNNTLDRMKRNY